ncbi:MAG: arginase family protein, partial [Nocardioidaceae bacterium]
MTNEQVPTPKVGPVDATVVPRFAGIATFARLPRIEDVEACDVAVVGVPFDTGTSFRPGARFGPASVREASRLLREYHPGLDVEPFGRVQVADAGDIACNPFDIQQAIGAVEAGAESLLESGARVVAVGGDHTIALPMLRCMARRHGPVALLHFDAHLDTWDTYFGAPYTHGTPFRRASEEGLLDVDALSHVGTRGPLDAKSDLDDDAGRGFGSVTSMDVVERGVPSVV